MLALLIPYHYYFDASSFPSSSMETYSNILVIAGKPISSKASVSAIFDIETDGRVVEKTFTRSIQGSSADHKIDNQSVSI